MSNMTQEYIITLKKYDDLTEFYSDMESEGTTKEFVPSRSVECILRRPISRNTHYRLLSHEAKLLLNDTRIEHISLKPKSDISSSVLFSTQNSIWDKSDSISEGQKNWGLYRCQLETNDNNWGINGTPDRTAEISLTGTGKNVDVIVVDDTVYLNHPEFDSRVVAYDWFNLHDVDVRGNATTIVSVSRSGNAATVTTAEPHLLNVNAVVDIVCGSDGTFSASSVTITQVTTYTLRYTNIGDNVSTTSVTGSSWKGVYLYTNFTGENNHATHVAGIIGGNTQGWAREANIYNLLSDSKGIKAGFVIPHEYLIDYVRQFHATKPVNPETGRKNPTLVNNSWGFVNNLLPLKNPFTGNVNPRFSKLNYRGSDIFPSSTSVDTGISGVCTTSAKIADLFSVAPNSGNRIVTTTSTDATVSSITFTEVGSSNLTNLGLPSGSGTEGIDDNDDAYWQLSLPFPITYLTTSYQNNVYVVSNSYLTFGSSSAFYDVGVGSPAVRKIFISGGDRNCQNIFGGEFGTSPNRTYTIRYEGYDGAYGAIYEISPNVIWEVTFYENAPNQIDVQVISNANYRGEFTVSELKSYGLDPNSQFVPDRRLDVDADLTDAVNDGIIFVGAAGNGASKIDVITGLDYNNYYVDNGLPVYYQRGGTPGSSHPDIICVGEVGSLTEEYKSSSSNTGPRINVYAPGTNIISSVYDNSANVTLPTLGEINLTISSGYAGSGSILAQAGRAAIVTTQIHGLSNGDIIYINDCSNSVYNVKNATITIINSTTFSFNISNTTYSNSSESLTGTIQANGVQQKLNGTSQAAAQVTGILAIALEKYPWMTQLDATNYIMSYAKTGEVGDSGGSYIDTQSLQGSPNKFLFFHKERPSQGIALPKSRQWLRPSSGHVFPRPQIRKK